ncbi:hypothetical protein BFP71_02515 [Roseivirga misakiensis]|uniref:Uncharacterized protein n=1 Tax=Roseivirga misakiensis TaxID=1563681 RepID=A0A1E5T5A2_9BACT|nr:hypothetical protein BFP71_02515 [Roseivirga misakiensis]
MGQWQKKFVAGGFAGYEHNIFLSPGTLLRDGDQLTRQDLLTSGFYEGVSFKGDFENKFKEGRWKFGFATSIANFHTNPDADRFTLSLKSSYRKRYAKGKYFEIAPEFSRRSQQGINESDGVLRTTFSYTKFYLPLHLDYYLGNKTWFKTETAYTFKAYDQNDLGEKVSYHSAKTGLNFSKKWDKNEAINKLTFSGGIEYRYYTDLELEDEDDEDIEEEDEEDDFVARPNNPIAFIAEERQWFFYTMGLDYNVKNDRTNFDYTLGLYFVGRGDSEKRFGYRELSPALSMRYSKKKLSVTASLKYGMRKFSTLTVGDNDQLLTYNYLRGSVRFNVALPKNKAWYIKGNLVNRTANNNNINSLAFRGYLNNSIETGISIRF